MLLLVAATGEFDPDALQADEVRLPAGNPAQPSQLGLTKPTIAKCSWLAIVREEDGEKIGGPVSELLFAAILSAVKRCRTEGTDTMVRDDRQDTA